MTCIRCKAPLKGRQLKFCSLKCKNTDAVSRHRRRIKLRSLEYKGKQCVNCGYDKFIGALQFHHPNGDKKFGIAAEGFTRAWASVKAELDKCIVLCANCHAESHWRVV